MSNTLFFSPATLARMVQVEMKRAQFFEQLADGREDDMPGWLKILQRLGVGGNLFYSKMSNHARYQ